MKAVILAGGAGTRLSEETNLRPKPMIEIGAKPILWHIMKIYSAHGINEFVVCLGYKGYMIKEYFSNYYLHMCDVTFDVGRNEMTVDHSAAEPWTVTLVDTGNETMTGGRLKRVASYVAGEDAFCMTYGDGVGNVDVSALVEFHRRQETLATVTAVRPPGRFGALEISGDRVTEFQEKPELDVGWINGGFFVLSPNVLDYIEGETTSWEREPLQRLAAEGELAPFLHRGFWHPMDTLWDRNYLEGLWRAGKAPWRTWD